MVVSMHSHSGEYCSHAHGTLEEVVLQAISCGFQVYGLSEHMPRTREIDLYPEEIKSKTTIQDLHNKFQSYIQEASRLQLKYAHLIQLPIGMETEWIHNRTIDEILYWNNAYKFDYIIGSVHHVREIPIDYNLEFILQLETLLASDEVSGTEAAFREYFDAQFLLISKAHPLIIGHFDLIRIFRKDHVLSDEVLEKIHRNIECILSYGGIVEINSRAYKKGLSHAYPGPDILQIMNAKGVKFTLSDDSHGPNDVAMHYDKLHSYLSNNNISTIWYPTTSNTSAEFKQYLNNDFWNKINK